MKQADRIRQFVLDHYVTPATQQGRTVVAVRAGDVHTQMSLSNAMPAVCGAIRSRKFDELASVRRIELRGPTNGANVYFTFDLQRCVAPVPEISHSASIVTDYSDTIRTPTQQPSIRHLNLTGALVLISCVKSKLSHSAPVRALYTSAWFRKVREIVEASGERWFVLSSRYGLIAPDVEIEPYDYTLNTLSAGERRAWAADVLEKLLQEITEERRVVMFAGQRYREFLVEPLRQHGIAVEVPMASLTRGEQLAWLSEH
jgi:hypothetical protein